MRGFVRAIGSQSSRRLACLSTRNAQPRSLISSPSTSARYYASAVNLQFGQPLHETHPHLLKAGELTPGITALEYAERRLRLAKDLPPNSVAILAAADIKTRSGAVFYKFHQEPNFFYLTGFNEPEAIAIIEKKGPSGLDHTFHLYVRPKDQLKERWEGSRSGVQAAEDVFNADETGNVDLVAMNLPDILSDATHVFTDIPIRAKERSAFNKIAYGSTIQAHRFGEILENNNVKPLRPFMHQLRAFKSEAEIANMRQAGRASGRGFTESMRNAWTTELDLEGFLEYQFKKNGCDQSAYVPVIAGGENANQIHYVRNDAELKPGQLITADAGGEYGGYVTDITRSWPVDGTFTAPQKDLYEMILKVQRSCIALCRESANMSLDHLHGVAESSLKDGLVSLGFDMSNKAMDVLFPHHLGHYLGLDIHDCPGYPRSGKLKEGQCITVEPGIYIDDSERWPKHFRNMGIRIEDSVCVEKENPLVLTTEAVKEVVDIEALRR